MFELRPYQSEARDAILREWADGRKKTLLVLPTGTGKTVVFAKVVEHQVMRGGRALIMAHRGELLTQAQAGRPAAVRTVDRRRGSDDLRADIRLGDGSAVENMGKASLLIDRLVRRQEEGLATPKQIRLLERYGFLQVGTWDFDDASAMISRIADNGWRLPYGINAKGYRP